MLDQFLSELEPFDKVCDCRLVGLREERVRENWPLFFAKPLDDVAGSFRPREKNCLNEAQGENERLDGIFSCGRINLRPS